MLAASHDSTPHIIGRIRVSVRDGNRIEHEPYTQYTQIRTVFLGQAEPNRTKLFDRPNPNRAELNPNLT